MKELYKPTLVCLNARQDKNLETTITYLIDLADDSEELESELGRTRHFIDELESFSFISPNERRYYMGYAENCAERRRDELREIERRKKEWT